MYLYLIKYIKTSYHGWRQYISVNAESSFIILLCICLLCTSCSKLVEVNDPSNSINAGNVYATNATAAAVLTGIYINMSRTNFGQPGVVNTLSLYAALSADELTLSDMSSMQKVAYYRNELSVSSNYGGEYWDIYKYIAICNAAIEGLTDNTDLTPVVQQQLLGEALFMRAFFYSYLVNLYGDVPLVLTTDYKVNALLPRASKIKVYEQMVEDLKQAEELLVDGYVAGNIVSLYAHGQEERVRPNKWAATALLARVYLYMKEYENADITATSVINQTDLYKLEGLNNTFLKNSREAIWQLQPVNQGWNTEDARLFIVPLTGISGTYPVCLSTNLLKSFEAGDERLNNWVNSVVVVGDTTTYYYSYKYKSATNGSNVTEYEMVLRLGEQYLIRAEARAELDNISGAAADLNVIRERAGLMNTAASTKADLMAAILHERQIELFTEWGHRWFDLKRTNTIDAVMSAATLQKGGTWKSYQQLYPIPLSEIQANVKLRQNTGY